MKQLKENGIKTFAFLGPILPGTPFDEVKKLLEEIFFVDKIYFDKLRYKPGLEKRINKSLFDSKDYYRELKSKFKSKGVFVY